MKELSINHDDMAWEEAKGYPTGTKIKLLREENGQRTFLLRLAKGLAVEAHCHTAQKEQHFVLEGHYEGNDKSYGPGSYRFIPRGVTHGPFTSEDGAIVLVIWED
jgi:anti-sigma factor ChrR (cupin superfamily)